jgi:hypothetical protein
MKKVMIAAMFLLCIGGTVLAQTAPKKEPVKKEAKKTTRTAMAKHHAKKSEKPAGKQG